MHPTNPITKTAPFLLGQMVQRLAELSKAYHNFQVKNKVRDTNWVNPVFKLAHSAEVRDPADVIPTLSRIAAGFLQKSDNLARKSKGEDGDQKPEPEAIRLMAAAKHYRAAVNDYSLCEGALLPRPRTTTESNQYRSLVRIGIDAKAPYSPTQASKTEETEIED